MTKVDRRRTEGRAVILNAALRCFVERGYHGTSIRDIGAAAQMTSAALYHHFGSKQDILVALMDAALAEAYERTRVAVVAADATPAAQLRALMHAWVLFHATATDRAFVGASEIRALEFDSRAEVVARRDAQQALFEQVVADGCADGSFATPHRDNAVRALVTMGTAVATWFDPAGPMLPEQVAAEYADLALAVVDARR